MLNYEVFNDFYLSLLKDKTKKQTNKQTIVWDVKLGCGPHDAFHQSYLESLYP